MPDYNGKLIVIELLMAVGFILVLIDIVNAELTALSAFGVLFAVAALVKAVLFLDRTVKLSAILISRKLDRLH